MSANIDLNAHRFISDGKTITLTFYDGPQDKIESEFGNHFDIRVDIITWGKMRESIETRLEEAEEFEI